MSTRLNLLPVLLGCFVMCVTASASAKRPSGVWNYFHFDGRSFIAGQPTSGTPFVAVRDGVRPAVLTHMAKIEATGLAAGTGALVGICYIQSSGGKLAPGPAYLPSARMPVRISAGGTLVATAETDEQGYFVTALAVGRYQVNCKETVEATVENGKTTLVPLRVGKRMVD
jgi:hypothetical protein